MTNELINKIKQKMQAYLGEEQMRQLHEVLCDCLSSSEEKSESKTVDLIQLFLAAKRVEGCSNKTVHYYESTIRNAVEKIDKDVVKITTDDLRMFLDGYQEENNISKVTVDNIRRILSSFFAWLEDEDYIVKSPVRRIHKVKTCKTVKFIEMFGDIENNQKGYPIKQIDEFSDLFAGATPSTKVSAYWKNGTIPWMSSGEVHMGRVTSTEKKISQLGYDKCSTKMVPLHTVVIALAGQGKTRGTVAVTEIELCTNQSLCAMVTDETVLSDYLYHNLRNRYEEIRNMCAIADGRGGLNLKIVGSIKVIVPSIEEQQQFVAFAEQSDKSKFYG